MRFIVSLLAFALLFFGKLFCAHGEPDFSRATDNPFETGPFPVNHSSIYSAINIFVDTNLEVYAPNAPGDFPVLYWITGLAGIIPAIAYTYFMGLIASHGFVVVGVWKVDNPLASFNASWFNETIDFVELRLETNLHRSGFDSNMHVDYQNSFIGGHSSGAHIPVAQFLAHCLNFKGQLLMNPVDGGDPLGILPFFVITPGEKVNFTVPTLQLVAEFDSVSSNVTGGPCAPDFLSGPRFFDAMSGPTWYVNATGFGHADFLDPDWESVVETSQFCVTDPDAPKDIYTQFIAGETVAFMNGVLDPVNNCAQFDYLETSGILGVETLNDFAANAWERCTPLQCMNM